MPLLSIPACETFLPDGSNWAQCPSSSRKWMQLEISPDVLTDVDKQYLSDLIINFDADVFGVLTFALFTGIIVGAYAGIIYSAARKAKRGI